VKAPWITSSSTAGDYYVIPNREVLIVGGTAQKNDWNREVSDEDTTSIWRGACEMFPSLAEAVVVSEEIPRRLPPSDVNRRRLWWV
jgi:glycine/D-amino acid oxidase-like deaminating enzyme